MHSITYNNYSIPNVIKDLFTRNDAIHSHFTRSCHVALVMLFHVAGQISPEAINFIGPSLWLKLPNYIRAGA